MESEIPLVDSSVWVALFHTSDTQHAKAKELFEALGGTSVAIHEYVVLEVCTVLQIKAGKAVAQKFLEVISDNQDIALVYGGQAALEVARTIFAKQTGSLSLVDCVLLESSKQYPLITFDDKLAKAVRRK